MSDLIDRQAALKKLTWDTEAYQTINMMPSIDAEPVKRGRWIRVSPARIYECSICGQNIMAKYIDCYKFCFGCGAKMDEVEDDLS